MNSAASPRTTISPQPIESNTAPPQVPAALAADRGRPPA
jgi:hypothetical protein